MRSSAHQRLADYPDSRCLSARALPCVIERSTSAVRRLACRHRDSGRRPPVRLRYASSPRDQPSSHHKLQLSLQAPSDEAHRGHRLTLGASRSNELGIHKQPPRIASSVFRIFEGYAASRLISVIQAKSSIALRIVGQRATFFLSLSARAFLGAEMKVCVCDTQALRGSRRSKPVSLAEMADRRCGSGTHRETRDTGTLGV